MDIFERLTIGMGACFVYGGYLAQLGPLYYPTIAYTIFKFSKTWVGLDLNDTKACSISFRKNHQIGAYIFLAILLGKLSQKRKDEKVEKVEKVD
jgi:4-hydroxybenzoate polyprenyltransferase